MKSKIYRKFVPCQLCGTLLRKVNGKNRYCTTCCPNHAARQRADRYKLSQPAFETLLLNQNNMCALCFAPFHSEHINGMHVDHDHTTGKVRALLCGTCNISIGYIERLLKFKNIDSIISYIQKHRI